MLSPIGATFGIHISTININLTFLQEKNMINTYEISPGVTLRCFADRRFKQGCLSLQIIRPQCAEEAAMNALIPTVLLRGCKSCPDLRSITGRLDDLYGASVGTMVRRVGDYQATGLCCGFLEDRFAMTGDRILEPMVQFLGELLLQPLTENGGFDPSFVAGEKKNLIATIESELNDKRAYAMGKLLRTMCRADSFGVPTGRQSRSFCDRPADTLCPLSAHPAHLPHRTVLRGQHRW